MFKALRISCVAFALLCGGRAFSQSQSAQIAELRRQVEALSKTVQSLQQQVNQQRLAPVFEGPPLSSGEAAEAGHAHHHHGSHEEGDHDHFNPQISGVVDAIGSYSHRADNVNFIGRDVEIMLRANAGRIAQAYLIVNAGTELDPTAKTDPFDEISLGLEEAAIETKALPYGLKVKGGQFFADFTRLGKVHSHELPFPDRPLSLDRIIGGEDKARGVELSWTPSSSHSLRLTAGTVDGLGAEAPVTSRLALLDGDEEDAFAHHRAGHRAFGDILYYGRAAATFEFGSKANLQLGANYARGRDRGERQLASGDFRFSWIPRLDRDDLIELGGEYLWSRERGELSGDALFDGGPTTGASWAHGGYIYAQYRFGKGWQPGLRFDYLHSEGFAQRDLNGDDSADSVFRRGENTRTFSAYLGYNFSESHRLRLELSYVNADHEIANGGDDDWQAFLQWTVTFGPHEHSF